MYSGTTLTPLSGRILGAHQKLDRVARTQLDKVIGTSAAFPKARRILHFEGRKGPDAIKRKSPAQDEPWHYYSPFDDDDSDLINLINGHYKQLVKELKSGNEERAAFEAAWLAHAITDGCTPAHHYPYEATIEELWGGSKEDRTTIRAKWFPPADTVRERLEKSWKVWGPKGLISAHGLFEIGIATMIAPLTMSEALPTERELKLIQQIGVGEWFKRTAREIAVLDMYGRYQKKGWTTKLTYQVRHKLAPLIVQAITLSWYNAMVDAGLIDPVE